MKIRKKIIIWFLIIALVPICLLAVLDYSFMHRTLTDRANQELLADARLMAKDIDRLVEKNLDEVRSEAQLPDFKAFLDLPPKERYLKTEIHRRVVANLIALSRKNQMFTRSYGLLDRNGLNVVDTYSPGIGKHELKWEYFKAPMRDLLPHVSLNFRPRLREEEGGLFFSAAVFNANKEVVGILRVHYNAYILQREITQYVNQKSKETVAVLLDEDHIRMAHSSKPERIFKSVVPLSPDRVAKLQQIGRLPHLSLTEMATNMVDFEKGITNAHSQPFFSFQESMADSQRQYAAACVKLDTLPWVLVFAKPYKSFLEPVHVQIQQTLILMFIVICFVVSGAFLASRYLAAPIVRLTSVANKVAKGDLQARTDIRSHDEIGELGSSFDHMATRIQSTLKDLRHEIAARERLNTILETTSDLVSTALPNTQVTYMNQAGRKLVGWSADEDPQTKSIPDMHPEWAHKIIKGESIPTAIRSGVWEGETAVVGPDGTETPVSQVLMSHKSPNGELEYLSTIMRDITERRRAEEDLRKYRDHLEEIVTERTTELKEKALELEKANLHLQEVDRLKSVFLASMSHELRTPLNSIIGFTGIILQGITGEINEEQRKQLSMVKNSGNHLLSLINELLDIAKIEAGRVEPLIGSFALDDVAREVAEIFSPALKEKGIELTRNVPEGIMLESDRRRVKQVLMNFLSNAVKFTDEGSITVAAGISKNEKVDIRVTDTGTGIKEEDMDKLFKPFQQVSASIAKRYEGTGLGLHLTRKLATLLGGDVSAKSELGKGSEFIFRIPITPK